MNLKHFKELESAVVARNPLLAEKLQPGLTQSRIRKILKRSGVEGDVEQLIQLFEWRNGTILDRDIASSQMGFFPDDIYHFLDLEMALGHMGHIREASMHHPKLAEGVGRYVPVFWNGATGWLAMDVKPLTRNRIVMIESEEPQPYKEAYSSFDEFFADAIRANVEDDRLRCFL